MKCRGCDGPLTCETSIGRYKSAAFFCDECRPSYIKYLADSDYEARRTRLDQSGKLDDSPTYHAHKVDRMSRKILTDDHLNTKPPTVIAFVDGLASAALAVDRDGHALPIE